MSRSKVPEMSPEVAAVFETYPASMRKRLLAVRRLIFETAAKTDGVGPLTETLKWGEPAYLTEQSKSGSTIRLGRTRSAPDRYAVFVNCNTTLADTFRTLFSGDLTFEGNRAILFKTSDPVPKGPLAACLEIALTYHRRKRRRRR